MGPDHGTFEDSAGAYVLGALPEPELQAFERHLAGCPACRNEVEELRLAADSLALAVAPLPAPAEVRSRVMAIVGPEAELLAAAGPQADTPGARRRAPAPEARARARETGARRRSPLGWLSRPAFALPAALLVLALGAVIGLTSAGALDGALDGDPEPRSVPAQLAEGFGPNAEVALQMGDAGAMLVGERVPSPPRGRVYQVWVKRPDADPEPTSALFSPRTDGSIATGIPVSMEGIEAVLVTHEPAGGSPSPTSNPVISVSPPA